MLWEEVSGIKGRRLGAGGPSMPVGKWMEIIGMDAKAPGGRREGVIPPPVTRPSNQRLASHHQLRDHSAQEALSDDISSDSQQAEPQKEKERKVAKKEKEEKDAGMWEPWLEISKGNFKPLKARDLPNFASQFTFCCLENP